MEARSNISGSAAASQAVGAQPSSVRPDASGAIAAGGPIAAVADRCFLCAFTPGQPCQVAQVEGRLARVVERAAADGAPLVTLLRADGLRVDLLLTRGERALAATLVALAPERLRALTLRAFHLLRLSPNSTLHPADVSIPGDADADEEDSADAATPAVRRLALQATPLSVVVLEPDLPLNITDINNAEYCVRQYPLRRMAPSAPTMATLRGTIIHQAFKELLKSGRSAPEEVAASLALAVKAQATDLALQQIDAETVTAEAEPHLRALAQWYGAQRNNLWGSVPDIRAETFLLAPEVGLKGRLDALMSDAHGDALLELKTGQNVVNLPKREHRWQVYGYQTLLAVRRPDDLSRPGATLLYSGTPGQAEAHLIPFTPRDLRRVIELRNQLALTHATGVVPPPPGGAKCGRCSLRETCQRASALLGWQAPPDDGPANSGKIGDSAPASLPLPLDPDDAAWFARMYELLRLEARAAERQSATLWRLSPAERCAAGIALGDLELDGGPRQTTSGEWEYRFHCEQTSELREGDAILLSDGDPIRGAIVTGSILSIGQRHVAVWAPERIANPRLLDRYDSDIVHDRTVRNLWRWLNVEPRLRALTAGRLAPSFDESLVAISSSMARLEALDEARRPPRTAALRDAPPARDVAPASSLVAAPRPLTPTPPSSALPSDEITRSGRHYLPHLERKGATYSLTFRLADALPPSALAKLKTEQQSGSSQRAESLSESANLHRSQKIEAYLDSGAGSRVLANPAIAAMVAESLRHFDGVRYQLFAWCVMPNHVHVVVQPLADYTLTNIVHSWKTHTALQAHRILGTSGEFWQREYYDHLVRDDADYQRVIEYVVSNPAKAGLDDWPWVEGPDELVARDVTSAALGTVNEAPDPTANRYASDEGDHEGRGAATAEDGGATFPAGRAFRSASVLAGRRAASSDSNLANELLIHQNPDSSSEPHGTTEPGSSAAAFNPEQRLAVERALAARDFLLVQGPPGTGKTSVVAEIARQAIARGERILLAAFTNQAVDNALRRLLVAGVADFVRLGHELSVAPELHAYRLHERARAIAPDPLAEDAVTPARLREALLRAPLVATTTATWSAERYDEAGDPLRFDLAIIDEATQLTTPALLGALRFARRFVLVGDERQLPPLVMSEEATAQGLKRSLFSELQARWGDVASVALRRQYRMHPVICDFPSREFYDGALVAEGAALTATLDLPYDASGPLALILDPQKPLVFVDTPQQVAGPGAPDDADVVAPARLAKMSAPQANAAQSVTLALRAAGLPAERIGIIAPYRAQVAAIRQRLAARGETDVTVDTVDRFQGGEREVIIFSFGGAAPMGLPGGHGRDFLADPQRLNVALTRAQRKLIILGDRRRLEGFPLLKRLIAYCERLYDGRGGVVEARYS